MAKISNFRLMNDESIHPIMYACDTSVYTYRLIIRYLSVVYQENENLGFNNTRVIRIMLETDCSILWDCGAEMHLGGP